VRWPCKILYFLAFSKIPTTLTVTNPESDHLMGKCEKRPALLGEVGGGRALATTRLYPALFSTVGSCRIWEPARFSKRPAHSLYVAV